MTLLDVITAAASNQSSILDQPPSYSIVLDADHPLSRLHHSADDPPHPLHLVHPVSGFELSDKDTQLIKLNKQMYTKLNRSLKNTNDLDKDRFLQTVSWFLEKVREVSGSSEQSEKPDEGFSYEMVKKFGYGFGPEVGMLVVEGCVMLEIWDLLKVMILGNMVPYAGYSKLIDLLVESRKTDLIVECMKCSSDFKAGDVLSVLRYFLVLMKDAHESMAVVREDWERQAQKAIENAMEEGLNARDLEMAKNVAILKMMAYDGFTDGELCLHYLFATMSVDELVLMSVIGKLNGKEIMALVKYLGKWLKKYDRFPVVRPSPEVAAKVWVKICQWVPKIEDILKCLGLVIDGHFSTLVLHKEFHDELRSLEGLVGGLVLEARLCCSMANVAENLREKVPRKLQMEFDMLDEQM